MQTQRIEIWQIGYYMQGQERPVHLEEPLSIRRGYHAALGRFWRKKGITGRLKDPVSKVRDPRDIQLLPLDFAGNYDLPLTPRPDLEDAVLLCDREHPITLTAPNGKKYRHVE